MSNQSDFHQSEGSTAVEQACADLAQYLSAILDPAMQELLAQAGARTATLHAAYGANLFLAHAVDYIQAIRRASGIQEDRIALVRTFDKIFAVGGARIKDRKFELIDALNNALKHIRLDPHRYRNVEREYGSVSFQSLYVDEGRVICVLEGYRFDYVRMVLEPAYRALANWSFESTDDVVAFARGEVAVDDGWSQDDALMASSDPMDAIDQMIVANNPKCVDCDQYEEDCVCAQFVYSGETGHFEPVTRLDFDFDAVMSRISGAYSSRDCEPSDDRGEP